MRQQTGDTRLTLDTDSVELTPAQGERYHALYREHFDFVFRNLRRLGVRAASIDDALQDVYVVVLRRIADLQEGTHDKAWLFAIALRIAGNYRRSQQRRGEFVPLEAVPLSAAEVGPFELAARAEARRLLHEFLATLDDNRRAVFIMTELEQMTAPEIAQTLAANVNTVYSWLRSARIEFTRRLATLEQEGACRG
jgi:RNA polymerase sigma-70 factor (ECF subfamily)